MCCDESPKEPDIDTASNSTAGDTDDVATMS